MNDKNQSIIIYNTDDGKAQVTLFAKEGDVWMNQNQLAELFDTSVPNISMHISNILNDNELNHISVVKDYLTTATDGKNYEVTFYNLDMILAIGFRVRSKRCLLSTCEESVRDFKRKINNSITNHIAPKSHMDIISVAK